MPYLPYILIYLGCSLVFLVLFCKMAGTASRDEEYEWMMNDLANGNK